MDFTLLMTEGSSRLEGPGVDDGSTAEPELAAPDVGDVLVGESTVLLPASEVCELSAGDSSELPDG